MKDTKGEIKMAKKFEGIYGEDVPLRKFWEYINNVMYNAEFVEVWINFESHPENLEDGEEDTFDRFAFEFMVESIEDGRVYGFIEDRHCYFDEDCIFYDIDTNKVIGYAEPVEVAEV